MQTKQIYTPGALKRFAGMVNLLPNLFWSALALVPACIFCYRWVANDLLFLFLGISLLPVFLPRSFLDKLQIAKNAATYKKLGISIFQYVSQNGKLAIFLVRKQYAGYKVVRSEKKSIERLLKQSYVNEIFHYTGFLFFGFITIFAVVKGLPWWAILFATTNLFYNVYPILMQQYIRVKLQVYHRKIVFSEPAAQHKKAKYRLTCAQ